MNKNIINFALTLIFAIIFSQFLPWWSVMLAGFLAALIIRLKKAAVFFVPFLAILIFWSAYAYFLSSTNDFILAEKIALLLYLGGSPYLLILITGVIGGIAAGTAAILGRQIRSVMS
ncbi:MAG: hypothetical protein AAF688_08155 [Bacteroidota bacterium]